MIGHVVERGASRRLIFAAFLVGLLAYLFWTESRYPSLDEKAMMGGAIQLEDPLSFEALIPVTDDQGVVERIGVSTVNWIDTNKKGMTFGVLFGSAFLTLLGYMRRRSFSGPFANSLYGMFLGAPLGVCVNCAAPIAKGLYQGGSRAETTLSAMVASPTLNIVVLTMAFALLPFYIAATKLVLSLVVILIAVPVICRFIPQEKLLHTVKTPKPLPIAPLTDDPDALLPSENIVQAFGRFIGDYARNLWFIIRTTLPLMLLAGFLGALFATFLPASAIAGWEFGPLGAAFAAIVGTFFPVPIGFDVVLSGALLNGGAAHGFIMTLVFTLGSFSIYSFFVVATSVGLRAGLILGATIMTLGFGAGLGADAWHTYQTDRALRLLTQEDGLLDAATSLPVAVAAPGVQRSAGQTLPGSETQPGLTVTREGYRAPVSYGDTPFTRVEAWTMGIDHPVEFSFADMWPPFWEGRSIASGDIDGDGDIDLVYASTRNGLYIYDNDGEGGFVARQMDLGRIADLDVFNAVLVDIDGDGWRDLFLTTYLDGLFVLPNREGVFDASALQPVANRDGAILALAASFGDLDQDGDLDVALGNWAAGWYRRVPGEESRNRILFNEGGRITGQSGYDLPGIPGETLSILMSDMNNDGALDLLVGNDFEVPDYFYLGDGTGGLRPIERSAGLIPETTTTTMSLTTADLTNNGAYEIYAAQIAGRASGVSDRLHMQPIERYCDAIGRDSDRATCQINMDIKRWYRPGNSLDPSQASRCAGMDEPYRSECRGMLVKDLAIQNNNPALCDLIPVGQERSAHYCRIHFQPIRPLRRDELARSIPQVLARNVLLELQADGHYAETADVRGLEVGGWSWDVSTADFDNDGWQDLYIVNGTWVPNEVTPSNIFLHNSGGGVFEEETDAFGLTDYLITAATSVVDFDRDGDLDIFTVPVNGPATVFLNNTGTGNGLTVRLRDGRGNLDGIGARIELRHGADGGLLQVRELQMGGGFMSFDVPEAHFGLGSDRAAASLTIRWPDGTVDQIAGPLEAGAIYTISRSAPTDGRATAAEDDE
ncbi:FG-GAP-like repeat-containing protein [Maricaulis sp.]|uniref:FG-GAP-like repeat-containing protein n=1 Tax=Maricaulis sp. TaxID=1486257 RepID=UPI0025C0F053|nr:FG-GAP-like repeat-containing protein [Maricaulis sp.]